jgi:SAM-dependent methyltransferase
MRDKITRLSPQNIKRYVVFSWKRLNLRKATGSELELYQEDNILRFLDRVDIRGKRILEIGGDHEGKVARAFRDLGAAWVTSINRDKGFESPGPEDGVERFEMDARELNLQEGSYDLVFATAVLEHLHNIETVLENVYAVTRRGGYVFLQGSPLWNCHNGHHLWVTVPSGRLFTFNQNNPIPDWGHLLMDRKDLQETLVLKGYDAEDSDAVAEWVYGTERINRYSTSYLKRAFYDSKFSVIECLESKGKKPDYDMSIRLSRKLDLPSSEFSICGILFLLQK